MEKKKVYFIKDISPKNAIRAFDALGIELRGNVAVKLHSGEPGNQNFLRPEFMKDIVHYVGGTIVECNTAYDGNRDTTEAHRRTMQIHGWVDIADVDIMDAEGPDVVWPVKNGKVLHDNLLGKDAHKKDEQKYCSDLQVTRVTPRACLLLSDDDHAVMPINSVNYYAELYRHDVPASIYVYPTGGHGWGMNTSFAYHAEMLTNLKGWLESF